MCGRFVATKAPQELAKYFDVDEIRADENEFAPSFNVAPQAEIWAIAERRGQRQLGLFHWGLVPSWAKDLSVGNRMINARAEALVGKSAFANAFKKRRCLIPADGFYEWKNIHGKKIPYYFSLKDEDSMAFAGLWEVWRDRAKPEDAPPLRSCTIITTDANEMVADMHDRMPVVLPASVWEQWLDPDNQDVESLQKLLTPAPAEVMRFWEVSRRVNNANNEGEDLIEPSAEITD